jgi:hypothetical protein
MNDLQANQIIALVLIFIIIGILFILNIFAKVYVYGDLLNKMKNNSGNYTSINILMMLFAIIAIFFLVVYLFKSKQTVRASLSRSQE